MKDQILSLRGRHDASLSELMQYLRIASISGDPAHALDVRAAADFVLAQLRAMGMENGKLIEAEGRHPIAYADWLHAPGCPTVIFYGHGDVQPPGALELWHSSPFEPVVRNDCIFARGASDDKGQVMLVLEALRSWFATTGKLPLNMIVVIEHEEECGGEHIESWIQANVPALDADAVLICDTGMIAPGLPTLTNRLRGILYAEIIVDGPARDLHSGLYGGLVANPLNGLTRIMAGLQGPEGDILMPNLATRVIPPSPQELALWAQLPVDVEGIKTELGVPGLLSGANPLEQLWARPSIDCHGFVGGHTGPEPMTLIPATARGKVSIRLVPGMDPAETLKALTAAVQVLTPKGLRSRVECLSKGPAVVVDPHNPFMMAAAAAMTETFGQKTVTIGCGASIPVVEQFSACNLPVILAGFALLDDGIHGPNEKFSLANFYSGQIAIADILGRWASCSF